MAYLDSGYVFLGSRGGDSQLIRLHETPLPQAEAAGTAADATADEPMGVPAAGGSSEAAATAAAAAAGAGAVADDGPNYVEVVDSWPSLAPILDFAVVDLERQGQGQVCFER